MSMTSEPEAAPIVERARERVLQTLLVWRARAVPVFALVALGVMFLDPRPWRVALLGAAALTLAVISWVELRAYGGVPLTPNRVRVNLVVSGLCQLGILAGTGGLASPIAPAVVIVALMFNLSAPPRLAAAFVLGIHIPSVWLLATAHILDLVPGLVPFGAFATATAMPIHGPILAALGLTIFFLGAVVLGQRIRRILDDAIEERVAEQQRALELHAEAGRTMSALSAEIAHELKNPLASIKGLAGLLRRDVDGAGKERLEVMRQEIDRMQGILEEFLHYSRPVVPLELRPTSLRTLLAEVLTLHEGMALARKVSFEPLGSEDLVATIDPRKVRQILVNVVQNAIEASPGEGMVRLRLASRERDAVIDVEDRGAGLDPSVRAAIFEVGATTKPQGSGIGLAVARGLARQHEGELMLEDREGGGCRARLVLPLDGPNVTAEEREASGSAGAASTPPPAHHAGEPRERVPA